MKRFVALTVALLLALGCVAALAEYEEPILFRGVEWGSSYAEIPKELELYDSLTTKRGDGVVYSLGYGDMLGYDDDTEVYADCANLPSNVAGYQQPFIRLFFATVPDEEGYLPMDENGNIVIDPERTKLFMAYYLIRRNPDDRNAIFDDLSQKLTLQYGDADMTDAGRRDRLVRRGKHDRIASKTSRRP